MNHWGCNTKIMEHCNIKEEIIEIEKDNDSFWIVIRRPGAGRHHRSQHVKQLCETEFLWIICYAMSLNCSSAHRCGSTGKNRNRRRAEHSKNSKISKIAKTAKTSERSKYRKAQEIAKRAKIAINSKNSTKSKKSGNNKKSNK